MKRVLLLTAMLLLLFCVNPLYSQSAYEAVNPFIGTAADGNTFPGSTLPFGMVQWGPDTRADGWYHYSDKALRGFSLTHISGAGCPMYADVPVVPWTTNITQHPGTPNAYALAFSHENEQAHPGFYSVNLDNGVKVELTATKRAGIGRFTFSPEANATLLLRTGDSANSADDKRVGDTSSIELQGNDAAIGTVLSGGFCGSNSNYTLYFAFKFSEPFVSTGTWDDSLHPDGREVTGHRAGAWVSFGKLAKPLLVKVGISFVSTSNAASNLNQEVPQWDFAAVASSAKNEWSALLDRVKADGGSREQRVLFYTGLYHMLLSPNIFSDVNGDYIGFDNKVRRLVAGEQQYANFSDWDIYRNVVQLQSWLFPKETAQMMQSLVRDADQSGWLPRWPAANDVTYVMGGDSSAILLSSAFAFGAHGFDTRSALRHMLKGATQYEKGPHEGYERPGLDEYLSQGYISLGEGWRENAASYTLEYNSADFAISRFAEALGDKENADRLLRAAQSWKKLFDKDSGFVRPRERDGSFIAGWDPDHLAPHHKGWDQPDQIGFEEGSTWQYTFMIPFNYGGLFKSMGGPTRVIPKLDKFFEKLTGWAVPNYTVTNEPDFCAAYAYLWAGAPWKTQEVIDRVQRETFFNKPDGLPGNDDLGATSGVYVWNALGMYPVIPGVGGVALGAPMFPRTTINLGNGSSIEVVTQGTGTYVQRVSLNGKSYDKSWIPVAAFSEKNNRLVFTTGTQPNMGWATQPDSLPPSYDLN